ncbi:hypothetical protein BD410DRAFT_606503 [Rickenella mellea]|uniref:Uncharacterized protein n=1 Tax=Rickenella mellea TaxID=50990 RepID=A0A4Y7QEP1_9AGAM|nr:hypothetical protein BD410DRAFT_606503 [Rickenella mellea]
MEALSADGGSVPPSSLDAVPPYIMHSFSPNMVGLQDVVGSNASALNWIVRYPAGSPLILSMVDSGGHQGGVEAQYTVVAGSTNACLPQPVATTFQVTANATILNTCDALKLSISGGKKPYTLSVLITDISEDTVMMGPNDDQFTWINKAPPNTTVLVSAQDA